MQVIWFSNELIHLLEICKIIKAFFESCFCLVGCFQGYCFKLYNLCTTAFPLCSERSVGSKQIFELIIIYSQTRPHQMNLAQNLERRQCISAGICYMLIYKGWQGGSWVPNACCVFCRLYWSSLLKFGVLNSVFHVLVLNVVSGVCLRQKTNIQWSHIFLS